MARFVVYLTDGQAFEYRYSPATPAAEAAAAAVAMLRQRGVTTDEIREIWHYDGDDPE